MRGRVRRGLARLARCDARHQACQRRLLPWSRQRQLLPPTSVSPLVATTDRAHVREEIGKQLLGGGEKIRLLSRAIMAMVAFACFIVVPNQSHALVAVIQGVLQPVP